jgi:hypothetical protein
MDFIVTMRSWWPSDDSHPRKKRQGFYGWFSTLDRSRVWSMEQIFRICRVRRIFIF